MEVPNHLHVYAWSVINRSEASRERDRLCRLIMTLKDHILLLQNAHVIVPVFFFFLCVKVVHCISVLRSIPLVSEVTLGIMCRCCMFYRQDTCYASIHACMHVLPGIITMLGFNRGNLDDLNQNIPLPTYN